MPDEPTITPAAIPDASATAPAQETPAAAAPSAIDLATQDFDKIITPKQPTTTKTTATAPDKDKAKPQGDKPPVQPQPGKPAAAKPGDDKVDWEKADPKLKGAYFKHQRESQAKIDSYEKRIKELESKPKETAADAKQIEEYTTQINRLKQDLASVSYERSEEFQTKFVARWQNEFKAAVSEISHLTVEQTDREGVVTTRPATEADFKRILNLPAGEQDEAIANTFGRYGNRVFARVMELSRITQAANEALAQHAGNAEKTAKEMEAKSAKERGEYEASMAQSQEELQTKWPQFFAPDENDPEKTEALQKGYAFVDDTLKKASALPPAERAAYNAVIRARAAGFLPLALKVNKLTAERDELKSELEKFRASDPGSAERKTGGAEPEPGATPEAGTIDEMTARFNKQ